MQCTQRFAGRSSRKLDTWTRGVTVTVLYRASHCEQREHCISCRRCLTAEAAWPVEVPHLSRRCSPRQVGHLGQWKSPRQAARAERSARSARSAGAAPAERATRRRAARADGVAAGAARRCVDQEQLSSRRRCHRRCCHRRRCHRRHHRYSRHHRHHYRHRRALRGRRDTWRARARPHR